MEIEKRAKNVSAITIRIDQITVLGKPYHPSADQKNGNTTSKLSQNSAEVGRMNSLHKVQPGERQE